MKLPNADHAIIPRVKVVNYLLDPGHPDNGGKADFFFRFGFKAEESEQLVQALLNHTVDTEITLTVSGFDGLTRYVLDGPLETPFGRSPKVRSIWVIERNQTLPRFVTAYSAR